MKNYFLIACILFSGLNISGCETSSIPPQSSPQTVTESPNLKKSDINLSDQKNQLQKLLDDSVKTSNVPGLTMYISTPDEHLILASGLSNLEQKQPMNPAEKFRIGSITKTFVSTVVLQLVDEGKIELDQPINNYLSSDISDNLPNSDQITVRDLLQHTSGLVNYTDLDEFSGEVDQDLNDQWTAKSIIIDISEYDPLEEPGEVFAYCNTNYLLLELIIEHITKNSLAQELRNRIYTPIGLNHTFMEIKESIPNGFSQGYGDLDENGTRENVGTYNDGNGLGDGGIISNAEDTGKFAENLFRDQTLLSDQMLTEMFKVIEDDEGDLYGLGLAIFNSNWGKVWGHDGKTTGFLANMSYLPDYQLTVVVLGNDEDQEDEGDPSTVAEKAVEMILNN
jgi:D-alanyl-D-alanine carboxypeptidase